MNKISQMDEMVARMDETRNAYNFLCDNAFNHKTTWGAWV
jgi:hypothetical protein